MIGISFSSCLSPQLVIHAQKEKKQTGVLCKKTTIASRSFQSSLHIYLSLSMRVSIPAYFPCGKAGVAEFLGSLRCQRMK